MKPTAAQRIGHPAAVTSGAISDPSAIYSATDGVRADGWGDAAEHPNRDDTIGHGRRAAEGVRPAAG